mgnify:CR=1
LIGHDLSDSFDVSSKTKPVVLNGNIPDFTEKRVKQRIVFRKVIYFHILTFNRAFFTMIRAAILVVFSNIHAMTYDRLVWSFSAMLYENVPTVFQ